MERLTDNVFGCMSAFCDAKDCVNYMDDGCCSFERYQRLKAYEDTGLEPEEVSDLLTIHRGMEGNEYVILDDELRSLLFAKNEGRLVVLPCKVGDWVYRVHYKEIRRHHVCQVHIGQTPAQTFFSCYGEYFGIDDFGKTVFLTREEAEAALKGEGNG